MPRFPAYARNAQALGRLIARASQDPDFCAALKQDPARYLREIGLPEETVELISFEIVREDDNGSPTVVLPYRLNGERLAREDEAYLEQVSNIIPEAARAFIN